MAMQRTACTRWTYRADDAGFAWGDCPRPRPGCKMDAGPWPADPHEFAPDVEEANRSRSCRNDVRQGRGM